MGGMKMNTTTSVPFSAAMDPAVDLSVSAYSLGLLYCWIIVSVIDGTFLAIIIHMPVYRSLIEE